ncbi:MAG: carbohydrate ABC transporter permease [Oscillospiraceae bacterium]|nr:carbohydrate ABC transporter permease [Oscillospiraceae bacterium]MDE5885602.1 carbohydrate ABC transporter permease [Oscillospiraceae bacterium]
MKIHSSRKFRKNFLTGLLFVISAAAAILFILPTVLTITNSFMTEKEITANYGAMIESASADKKTYISEELNLKFIPDSVSIAQYLSVLFKSPDYLLKFWNSVILVVPITVFQVLLAAVTAYGFSRYRGKVREIIFFIYIILMLMPYQVTLVPNYLVSDFLGILGSKWAIILPGIFSPFSVYLLTKVMRRIPKAYFEAARLDGAGEIQIFTHICLPLCRSSMLSVGLLVFIDYWNMVEQPLILLESEDQYPLSVFLSQINSGDVGLAFAVAVVYMIPALLLFLYGEEYLVEGITYAGGVKG